MQKKQKKSVFHWFRKIYADGGVRGLYTGLTARLAKTAPACAIMVSTFEYGKNFFEQYNMNEYKRQNKEVYSALSEVDHVYHPTSDVDVMCENTVNSYSTTEPGFISVFLEDFPKDSGRLFKCIVGYVSDVQDFCNLFTTFSMSVIEPTNDINANKLECDYEMTDCLSTLQTSATDIANGLRVLDISKGCDPDNIPPVVLRYYAPLLLKGITGQLKKKPLCT
ncbi:hypothetical protein J6590_062577 [Homalodisca vitripennis]|nr:hypothetical protein J6590_062577 [Homalodisca vitripennis]